MEAHLNNEPLAQIEKDAEEYADVFKFRYDEDWRETKAVFKAGAISQNNKVLLLLASGASHISEDNYVIPKSYFESLKITDK